jgi:hypothetical protein
MMSQGYAVFYIYEKEEWVEDGSVSFTSKYVYDDNSNLLKTKRYHDKEGFKSTCFTSNVTGRTYRWEKA